MRNSARLVREKSESCTSLHTHHDHACIFLYWELHCGDLIRNSNFFSRLSDFLYLSHHISYGQKHFSLWRIKNENEHEFNVSRNNSKMTMMSVGLVFNYVDFISFFGGKRANSLCWNESLGPFLIAFFHCPWSALLYKMKSRMLISE